MQKTFSVIIPVKNDASALHLSNCLKNLYNQTYKPFEIIIVISPHANKTLFYTLKIFPKVKVVKIDADKPTARNLGAKHAKGKFLVHIDVNDAPDTNTLKEAYTLIKNKKAKAIIMHEDIKPTSVIARIRKLERKFNRYDPVLATPQIIKTTLFKKINGFDEEIKYLDDWSLQFRLKKAGIKFFETESSTFINVETNILEIIKRKYKRGQETPTLIQKYQQDGNIKYSDSLYVYLKNYQLFFSDSFASLGLLILKPIEWVAFFLGNLNPSHINRYKQSKAAKEYDKARSSTNYVLYKDFAEKEALSILLKPKPKKVLEIGAGTGRITKYLTSRGIRVTPTEPSKEMIKQYKEKKGLPPPINIAGESLRLNLGRFDCVLGIRIIWHIKDSEKRNKILSNAVALSKQSIIFDFTNAKRYNNLLIYPLSRIYAIFFKPSFFIHDHFFTDKEITEISKKYKLNIDQKLPLDLLTPFWINLFPKKLAKKLFSYLFNLEIRLAKIIPPGRWLIKFTKTNNSRK